MTIETVNRSKHYSEYATTRKPIPSSNGLLTFWHRRMLKIAERHLGSLRQKTLLEIGVGYGYFAQETRAFDITYKGIEMNEELAKIACEQGFDVICGTVPPLPDSIKVDIIWLSHVLEHSQNYSEARGILASIFDSLPIGGSVVVISPDYLSFKSYFWDVDWSHGFPTTLRRCKQVLSDVGFQDIVALCHAGTISNPYGRSLYELVMKMIPFDLLDIFFRAFTGRDLSYSFMTMFGWRQVYLIAKK